MRLRDLSDRLILGSAAALESAACVYAFFVIPLVPLLWPATLSVVQFVSSGVLQLVALPVLAVAGEMQGARTRREAEEQHAEMRDLLLGEASLDHKLNLILDHLGIPNPDEFPGG